MAIVTKKCYYSNISKAIYFYFFSSNITESMISQEAIETLTENCKNLSELHLGRKSEEWSQLFLLNLKTKIPKLYVDGELITFLLQNLTIDKRSTKYHFLFSELYNLKTLKFSNDAENFDLQLLFTHKCLIRLEHLDFGYQRIKSKCVKRIAEKCPNLKIFTVNKNCEQDISEKTLKCVAEKCKNLEYLENYNNRHYINGNWHDWY